MELYCQVCGIKITEGRLHKARKYCSKECARTVEVVQWRESRMRHKDARRERPVKPTKKTKGLAEIQREARAMGLSYGQYQLLKYMEAK